MSEQPKNRGGRPPKYPGEGKRPALMFRCRPRVVEKLDALAARNGWSRSEAAERALEGYFEREDMRGVVLSALNEALDRREPSSGEPLGSPPPAYAQ